MDLYQELALVLPDDSYSLGSDITSIGGGLNLQYDSRDMPTNAYQGRFFEAQALGSVTSGDVNETYQSYSLRFRSYHHLADPFVLAVDLSWCDRSGKVPLWDTCRLSLRGFPLTEYLGIESYQGQVEARWRAYKKLGFVAFGGYGYVGRSFSDALGNERVPSVGAGVRYMVLESKRINLRVDYARSGNSEAWYLSVGEAF
jgi:hemolysin activation/secretion protein